MTTNLLKGLALSLLLAAAPWMAGCMDRSAEASLEFDGSGDGRHSEQGTCDAEGRLKGSGEVQDGSVRLRITDADGSEVFERSFEGPIDMSGVTVTGDSGTWKMEADRAGDDLAGDPFKGDYRFELEC